MSKFTAKKLKVVATLASIALFATAFTPGGCTINIDQDLLNQLGGLLSDGPGMGMGRPIGDMHPGGLDDDDGHHGQGHDSQGHDSQGHDGDNDGHHDGEHDGQDGHHHGGTDFDN